MAKSKAWKSFAVWMVLLLVVALGAGVITPGRAEATATTTWYVDPLGTDDGSHGTGTGAAAFKTIQYAINDGRVVSGDTINVAAGTYNEVLTINKSLTLQGAGSGVTTVTGAQTITTSNVTVDGFTLNGGITISDTASIISGVTISHNLITGAQYGIRVGLGAGLGVNGVTINTNTITANTKRGILFYNAGDYAAQHVSNVTISGNEITNNTDGGTQGGGISTYGPGPNTIIDNIISGNNGNGVSIKYDDGDIVRGNTVTNNTAMGINMHEVTNALVENNTVSGHVSEAVVTTFWGGTVLAGKGSGIYIHEHAVNNTIRYNTITGNRNGILINREVAGTDPSANSITYNNITGNTYYGLITTVPAIEVDATLNWWGSTNGPTHAGNTFNVGSQGDGVSDNVRYVPWLNAAYPGGTSFAPVNNTTQSTQFSSIQAAIDAATTGDTINAVAGTYDEQVVIDKSLTLQGAGDTTIIQPSSAAKLTQVFDGLFWFGGTKQIAGIVVANVPDGSSVPVKNLKVDGSSVTTQPAGANYLAGIFYRETGGTVDTVSIVGGGIWTPDRAYGMYLSAATNTVSVEVKGSSISNYDKNGIEAHGNKLTVNIHHNTITGRGLTLAGDEPQNGVNVGRDAVATVNYNTISSLVYSSTGAVATGILFYHYVTPTGKSATANNNTVTDCQVGIMFKNANGSAQDNIVSGGTVGLDGIFAQPNYAGAYTASFVHNTVSGITKNAAIDAETYATLTPGTGATLTATITNNTLTGGYTTADGIYVGGSAGSVTATISGNTISGWPEYGINLGDACVAGATITGNVITTNTLRGVNIGAAVNAANVNVNYNNIVGNGTYGVNNGGTGALNATNNWWGANDGPGAVGPGSGDKVGANVAYDPWLVIGVSANPTSIVANGTSTSAITADMTKNSNGTVTGPPYIPDGTQITFTTDKGEVGSLTVDKPTTNGKATATLTSSSTVETATVSAKAPGDAVQAKVSTTVNFMPPSPTDFTATAFSSTQIDLAWTTGAGAEKTMVRRSTTAFPTAPDQCTEVCCEAGDCASDTDLLPNTTYYYSAWSWVGGSDIWSLTYATDLATTLAAPLTVTGVSPNQGTQGKTLTNIAIIGTNFTGATEVSFGDGITVTSFRVNNATRITATIAIAGAATPGPRNVSVTTAAGTGVGAGLFTVLPAPAITVTGVSPNQCAQAQALRNVVITGTNFAGATLVSFGDGVTVTSFRVTATGITANIAVSGDAALGTRNLSVTTPVGTGIGNDLFTVLGAPAPTVTRVSPNRGIQGRTYDVLITGTNFRGVSEARFGGDTEVIQFSLGEGIHVNSFTVNRATMIRANITIADDAVPGPRDVSVTTPGGTGVGTGLFTVKQARPIVTGVSPNQGARGQTLNGVIITGTHLTGATAVSFGAGIITSFTVDSDTQITANINISTRAAVGYRTVSVTTPGGIGRLNRGFTVTRATGGP